VEQGREANSCPSCRDENSKEIKESGLIVKSKRDYEKQKLGAALSWGKYVTKNEDEPKKEEPPVIPYGGIPYTVPFTVPFFPGDPFGSGSEKKKNKDVSFIKTDGFSLIEGPECMQRIRDLLKLPGNRRHLEEYLKDDRSGFSGGTFSDLFKQPDLTPYQEARSKLKNKSLMRRIHEKTIMLRRRRRSLSEYDGEWDISRKWEIRPFHHASRQPIANRHLKIRVSMDIACGTKAQSICEYGSLVWGINDLLESVGYNTDIVLHSYAHGVSESRKLDAELEINVKRAGQYISPTNIARCLNSNFYRRTMFALYVKAADNLDQEACSSLGTVNSVDYIIRFEKGLLEISPRAIQFNSEANVQEVILKAMEASNDGTSGRSGEPKKAG
jgi:hypothetical protein